MAAAVNRELRAGSRFRPPFPHHLFAVGDPHGDEIIAIDTRQPDGPVWWLDHGIVGHQASYQSHSLAPDVFAEPREAERLGHLRASAVAAQGGRQHPLPQVERIGFHGAASYFSVPCSFKCKTL